jgi:hypothetical protein
MFTVEESRLLARMLRAIIWILVFIIVGSGSCLVVHRIHQHRSVLSQPHS